MISSEDLSTPVLAFLLSLLAVMSAVHHNQQDEKLQGCNLKVEELSQQVNTLEMSWVSCMNGDGVYVNGHWNECEMYAEYWDYLEYQGE